jgi:hypothetical protein
MSYEDDAFPFQPADRPVRFRLGVLNPSFTGTAKFYRTIRPDPFRQGRIRSMRRIAFAEIATRERKQYPALIAHW